MIPFHILFFLIIQFHHLLGKEYVDYYQARDLFENVFDVRGIRVVDKLEVISAVCLLSAAPSLTKLDLIFDSFDFNKKGYLLENEIFLMVRVVCEAAFKVDPTLKQPTDEAITKLVGLALKYSQPEQDFKLRKPDFYCFVANTVEVSAFVEVWRGHSSQILIPPGEKVMTQT